MQSIFDSRALGERVLTCRESHGMSKQALATTMGVNRLTIYRIEKGLCQALNASTVIGLALALGISTDFLLLGKERIYAGT